jgi:hypothetical protein
MLNFGNSAIAFQSGLALHVENCTIDGSQSNFGISFFPMVTAHLLVKDTVFRNNGSGITIGILTQGGSGTAFASIDRVHMESGGGGLTALDRSRVNIRDSVIAGNGAAGLYVATDSAAVGLNVDNSLVSDNNIGIYAAGNNGNVSTVRISNTTITDNTTAGLAQALNGVFLSRGNNTIEGNGINVSGTLGTYATK